MCQNNPRRGAQREICSWATKHQQHKAWVTLYPPNSTFVWLHLNAKAYPNPREGLAAEKIAMEAPTSTVDYRVSRKIFTILVSGWSWA